MREEAGAAGEDRRLGAEQRQVDAGADGGDPRGVGVVEVDELAGLLGGVGDELVGGGHDLLLAEHALGGLRIVVVGEGRVLHLGHRVHGVDERDAPPLLHRPAGLAGQPVVRVEQVVVAGLVARLGAQDAGREAAQVPGQLGLVQLLERPGDDVADEDAGGELDDGRQGPRRGAGEDVDLDAALGEPLGHLDDVDVHAARVAGPRLVEGEV